MRKYCTVQTRNQRNKHNNIDGLLDHAGTTVDIYLSRSRILARRKGLGGRLVVEHCGQHNKQNRRCHKCSPPFEDDLKNAKQLP